ncbi:MAG TPA: glycolate oxidase iron-sulfur subunit [Rhizobiales bacterium]|jgi:glycolate oxidase iron-sulfur subunit|nr:glycolate oxidase iron-sulfur subunit [Hyphomicrobiales bacterium]HAN64177.1 glycolate oxidase iron-sulfur subunit [Hyphomicrobiales bacterium]HBH41087.1 glycolate oxidase iron-sulfur subunit [Hyphomicrobiales bacterium]
MQTNFNALQLADPTIARADAILRRCVHCGLCTATCPTYVLTGDERDSPRGRIYLMKQMFEDREVTPTMTYHIDRCLSCLSCMTTCPSGVDYMHLVDLARTRIEMKGHRTSAQRTTRWILSKVLPYPRRFRLALMLGWLARPFRGLIEKAGFPATAAALALVPKARPKSNLTKPKSAIGKEPKAKRVALMLGCVQEVMVPSISLAAIRLLRRHGVDVVVVKDEGCCGALVHHLGREEEARDAARRNIDAWTAAMREKLLDAIVITTSGCGTMVKDYGSLLSRDRGYAERAAYVSGLTRDITEFVEEIDLMPPLMWTGLRVAYHAPCSLQHGQKLDALPLKQLSQCGFNILEIPEGHLCCGSAGTYNLLEPELSGELRERKLRNIASVTPDVIATANIGCVMQLQGGTSAPFVHTVELLDWATGGPCPPALEKLNVRSHQVETLVEMAREAALID